MSGTKHQNSAVMILSRDAQAYRDLLRAEPGFDAPVHTCTEPEQAAAGYRGERVVLGEPGLIADIIDRLPGVEWVQSTWAGVTPLVRSRRRDYRLTGVKGIFGAPMTEYVLAYLLANEIRLVERLRAQQQGIWLDQASGRLAGRHIGIMGTGSIGRHMARVLTGLNARVRGLSRSGTHREPFHSVQSVDRLPAFLEGLDYLLLTLPDTPETTGLLDASALSALPPHAVVINVGRGNAINHDALVEALNQGRIGGAVLDVFEEEPLPAKSPLWTARNLTITAHVAALTSPIEMLPVFIDNHARFTRREPLRFEIDFDRGY